MLTTDHPRRWHRGSEFGPGPRCPLSDDARRRWLARVKLERLAGSLTSLRAEVLEKLPKLLGLDGRCDPSHAFLADALQCSEGTVRAALADGVRLELLRITRRIVLVPWPQGGRNARRAVQTSNAYELLPPTGPVKAKKPRHRLRPQTLLRRSLAKTSLLEREAMIPPWGAHECPLEARKRLNEIAARRSNEREAERLAKRSIIAEPKPG